MWLAHCALTLFCRGNVNGDISHSHSWSSDPGYSLTLLVLPSLWHFGHSQQFGISSLMIPSAFPIWSEKHTVKTCWNSAAPQSGINSLVSVMGNNRQVETEEQKQSCCETQTSIRASLYTSPKKISPELGIWLRTGNELFFTLNNTQDTEQVEKKRWQKEEQVCTRSPLVLITTDVLWGGRASKTSKTLN